MLPRFEEKRAISLLFNHTLNTHFLVDDQKIDGDSRGLVAEPIIDRSGREGCPSEDMNTIAYKRRLNPDRDGLVHFYLLVLFFSYPGEECDFFYVFLRRPHAADLCCPSAAAAAW